LGDDGARFPGDWFRGISPEVVFGLAYRLTQIPTENYKPPQGGFFFFTIPAARRVGRPGEFDPQWFIREPDDFVSILPELWPDRFEQILWDFIPELNGNSVSGRLTAAHNE
jgi:hypothetical protein